MNVLSSSIVATCYCNCLHLFDSAVVSIQLFLPTILLIKEMNSILVHYAVRVIGGYVIVVTTVAAGVAVLQERKIWKPAALPSLSLWGCIKVFVYNQLWMLMCLCGVVLVTLKWILMLGTSDLEYDCHHFVEHWVARCCTILLTGRVQIKGAEHLPTQKEVPAPIFIANHASQLDVGAAYYLNQRFKWIAKQSVYYLPGVGQVMWLGGHVMIDRRTGKNQSSVSTLFEKSKQALQAGIPMFLFPQGTRRMAEQLPFKNGAFVMAQTNQTRLIPLSIQIPHNIWNSLYPFNVLWGGTAPLITLTVHPSVKVTGKEDLEDLKQKCVNVIYRVLPRASVEESRKEQ